MRITMFSINPLYPNVITGGASKHLRSVAIHLGELGHHVRIMCTRIEGSDTRFLWHPNVEVYPVLPFKQPFPQPYAISGHDMAQVVQLMGDALHDADRFYVHDGELLFPFLSERVPTVVSLRDNVYPETLHGGFLFRGHRLILISEYSRKFVLATMGRFFPALRERIVVIHNGIDWDTFRPTPPRDILSVIPVDPTKHKIVIHPHRPEESKGLLQTIAVADLLVHRCGWDTLRVLAPKWLESQNTPELLDFYARVQADIDRRGLTEHVIFHDWVPSALMPEYYAMGDVSLSLGSFAETFGNSVYESLGCGTPAVVARVTTHRELLPPDLIDTVDYADTEVAAALVDDILRTGRRTSQATLDYLRTHYGVQRQLDAYADVILNAEHSAPLIYRHPVLNDDTPFRLAPWCVPSVRGVYHDFNATYADMGALGRLLIAQRAGISRRQARESGIAAAEFDHWFEAGYIVPNSDAFIDE